MQRNSILEHPSITTISDFFRYFFSGKTITSDETREKNSPRSVLEDEVDSQHQQHEAYQVVQPQLCLKGKRGEYYEYGEGDHLLDHL